MPVPAKRRSSSKGARNRSHQALTKPGLVACKNCGAMKKPHQACPECGNYRGREVSNAKPRVKKAAKK